MNNTFKVYDLICDNILGNVSFEKVPQISGNNFIYSLGGVDSVLKLTQDQYDQLIPDQNILYIITE
jgi:hypothetical protein